MSLVGKTRERATRKQTQTSDDTQNNRLVVNRRTNNNAKLHITQRGSSGKRWSRTGRFCLNERHRNTREKRRQGLWGPALEVGHANVPLAKRLDTL